MVFIKRDGYLDPHPCSGCGSPVTGKLAHHVGHPRRDSEDCERLQEVGEGRRVLEGVCRVSVEEPATVRAQLLDRFLRGYRSLRNRLLPALDRGDLRRSAEVIDDTLGDQHDAQNEPVLPHR